MAQIRHRSSLPARRRAAALWLALGPLMSLACESSDADRRLQPNAVRFADGTFVRLVQHDPPRLRPGEDVRVRLEVDGRVEDAKLLLMPPRVVGRQVALGGAPPPPTPAPDDRVQEVQLDDADASEGARQVSLRVPEHWGATGAALVLARAGVRAVEGPRTSQGHAVLALLPVEVAPTRVSAFRVASPPDIDGRLDEPLWEAATWTSLVDSTDAEPNDALPTAVAFAWDDAAFYMGVRAQDFDVWSSHEERDAPLWEEEAVELFLFGDEAQRRRYLELQVAPTGAVFDARFETYRKGDVAWHGEWSAAVHVDGTLENPSDRDRGFSVELSVPWREVCAHTDIDCPPNPGDVHRINVFRLDRARRNGKHEVTALALSSPRVPDFHAPEHAALLELRATPSGDGAGGAP